MRDSSDHLTLQQGCRVGVVGGGPAGSFFSYFLLEMARDIDLDVHLDIYEPRDFSQPGPTGCNMCGGIVSESLVQALAAEGIELGPEVIQRAIDSYSLHMDVGDVHIATPRMEKRIASVHRGGGPRGMKQTKLKADRGSIYVLAHQLYWDFLRLSEGSSRWWFDKKKHDQLAAELEKMPIELDEAQKTRCEEVVEEEIQTGRLPKAQKKERLRDLEEGGLFVARDWGNRMAVEEATIQLKIPGEPEVITALIEAETPDRVRKICEDAYVIVEREVEPGIKREVRLRNWPVSYITGLPDYLSQYASEFVAAKNDPRFPKSPRSSSRLKQIWFLSRALSGAIFGVSTRTAINLVGSQRPDQMFDKSRFGKPARKQRKKVKRKS